MLNFTSNSRAASPGAAHPAFYSPELMNLVNLLPLAILELHFPNRQGAWFPRYVILNTVPLYEWRVPDAEPLASWPVYVLAAYSGTVALVMDNRSDGGRRCRSRSCWTDARDTFSPVQRVAYAGFRRAPIERFTAASRLAVAVDFATGHLRQVQHRTDALASSWTFGSTLHPGSFSTHHGWGTETHR